MEQPAHDSQLLNVALDHARTLAQTLDAQREDLSRVAPNETAGAAKLERALRAVAEVQNALGANVRDRAGPGNQS